MAAFAATAENSLALCDEIVDAVASNLASVFDEGRSSRGPGPGSYEDLGGGVGGNIGGGGGGAGTGLAGSEAASGAKADVRFALESGIDVVQLMRITKMLLCVLTNGEDEPFFERLNWLEYISNALFDIKEALSEAAVGLAAAGSDIVGGPSGATDGGSLLESYRARNRDDAILSIQRVEERCQHLAHRMLELQTVIDGHGGDYDPTALIADERGARMWCQCFGLAMVVVSWDVFFSSLEYFLQANLRADEYLMKPYIDTAGDDWVSVLEFASFLSAFGPLDDCRDKIRVVSALPFFHGAATRSVAVRRLSHHPPGTFLVRYSQLKVGTLILSYSAALPPEFRLEDIVSAADGATTGSMAELPTYGGTPSSFGAHFSGLDTQGASFTFDHFNEVEDPFAPSSEDRTDAEISISLDESARSGLAKVTVRHCPIYVSYLPKQGPSGPEKGISLGYSFSPGLEYGKVFPSLASLVTACASTLRLPCPRDFGGLSGRATVVSTQPGSDWWTASDGVQILPFQRCDSVYFHPASQEPIAVKRKQISMEFLSVYGTYRNNAIQQNEVNERVIYDRRAADGIFIQKADGLEYEALLAESTGLEFAVEIPLTQVGYLLVKRHKQQARRRWAYLTTATLSFHDSEEQNETWASVSLADCAVEDVSGAINTAATIACITPSVVILMTAEEEEQIQDWLANIRQNQRVTMPYLSKIPRRSGLLVKQGGKSVKGPWQERWFVLRGPFLYYYKHADDIKYRGVVDLQTCIACTVSSDQKANWRPCMFEIVVPARTYYLVGANRAEMQEWISAINFARECAEANRDYRLFF